LNGTLLSLNTSCGGARWSSDAAEDFEIEQLKAASRARDYVRDQLKPSKLTTLKTLAVEQEIVRFAASGVGRHPPFNTQYIPSEKLAPDQSRVVSQLLGSRRFPDLVRGAAGTGKSFALMEVFEGLKNTERSIHVLAPQRQQALRSSQRPGFGCNNAQ